MEEEIWKDIAGYEGYFQVSNLGRVKSLERVVKTHDRLGGFRKKKERILKCVPLKNKYLHVCLWKDNEAKTFLVHRLVANAFIPNPSCLPQVNHKDERRDNNNVSNLEWCTANYNSNYGSRTERSSIAKYKRVCMFDMEGNLIKEFDSLKQAQMYIGSKVTPEYLTAHHSLHGFQFRLKGDPCGPYIENRGKYKRK